MKPKIIPERKLCTCGNKVENHHWFCDLCYGKREKKKNSEKSNKLNRASIKTERIKRGFSPRYLNPKRAI